VLCGLDRAVGRLAADLVNSRGGRPDASGVVLDPSQHDQRLVPPASGREQRVRGQQLLSQGVEQRLPCRFGAGAAPSAWRAGIWRLHAR
jgi:hypothetical protein